MGHLLHPSATTTAAVRRAIQNSQESIRTLTQRYNVNPKTVAKWKKRSTLTDIAMGPKQQRSTVLSVSEEALIVAFRQQTFTLVLEPREQGMSYRKIRKAWDCIGHECIKFETRVIDASSGQCKAAGTKTLNVGESRA